MAEDKNESLRSLKLNKRNRRLKEICDLLTAFGFTMRKAKREGSLWQKGSVTITLPSPHGGDPVLKMPYISLVIREIERAEILELASEAENEY